MELWNTNRFTNIYNVGLSEGGSAEKRAERMFEKTMAENYPNLIKDVNINMIKSQCTLR